MSAQSTANGLGAGGAGVGAVPNTTHNSNYNKLKNTYITQIKSHKVNSNNNNVSGGGSSNLNSSGT